ncbi:hypothetical protein QE152_g9863 [Popillia japonica]|uniref:Uncharacterized protein n=1 Tax=Popillia japonica TaxID=7064 RepID=A0AAW1LWJ4_POPJA
MGSLLNDSVCHLADRQREQSVAVLRFTQNKNAKMSNIQRERLFNKEAVAAVVQKCSTTVKNPSREIRLCHLDYDLGSDLSPLDSTTVKNPSREIRLCHLDYDLGSDLSPLDFNSFSKLVGL